MCAQTHTRTEKKNSSHLGNHCPKMILNHNGHLSQNGCAGGFGAGRRKLTCSITSAGSPNQRDHASIMSQWSGGRALEGGSGTAVSRAGVAFPISSSWGTLTHFVKADGQETVLGLGTGSQGPHLAEAAVDHGGSRNVAQALQSCAPGTHPGADQPWSRSFVRNCKSITTSFICMQAESIFLLYTTYLPCCGTF